MTEHDQMLEYYAAPGPMTDLAGVPADVFDGLPTDPVGLCRAVPGLVARAGNLAGNESVRLA